MAGGVGHASLLPLPLAGEGRGEGDRMECGEGARVVGGGWGGEQ